MNDLDEFLANQSKFKYFGYPRAFYPDMRSKRLPQGKTCADCYHFKNGLRCNEVDRKNAKPDTDYCLWGDNRFTEVKMAGTIDSHVWVDVESLKVMYPDKEKDFFAGTKDELVLHEVLERAGYRCECVGGLCTLHTGRCETVHKKIGGKSPLLLQPKNASLGHSLENSVAMCAPCANANTINRMSIQRKQKKVKTIEGQESII